MDKPQPSTDISTINYTNSYNLLMKTHLDTNIAHKFLQCKLNFSYSGNSFSASAEIVVTAWLRRTRGRSDFGT